MTLTCISIVSLRNEGFPTFRLCLTTGGHLCFLEKLRNSRSRRLFANSSWGNAARFMYAAVSDISYIAESVASWEKESGSVAKLGAFNFWFGYCAIYKKTLDVYIYIRQPLKTMLGPRRQAMAHFPTEYYEKGWPEGGVASCAAFRSLLLRKTGLKCCPQYKCRHLQCLINTQSL